MKKNLKFIVLSGVAVMALLGYAGYKYTAEPDLTATEKQVVPVEPQIDENFAVLMTAIGQNADLQMVSTLIKGGANVNGAMPDGITPLMLACNENANPEIVKVLLDNGADVNAKNKTGITALGIALINNVTPEIVNMLLQHGADANAEIQEGWTLLMSATAQGKQELMRGLVAQGGVGGL